MGDLGLGASGSSFGLDSLEGRRLLTGVPPYANALDNDSASAADGTLHVAWYDSSTGSLEYASRSASGTWSNQGTIDEATLEDPFTLRGSATAFEATVAVLVLDQEGNVLAETFTNAGSNGEQGPYTAEIDVDPNAGTPFWVMIGEGDASGEGRLLWATTYDLFAGAPG